MSITVTNATQGQLPIVLNSPGGEEQVIDLAVGATSAAIEDEVSSVSPDLLAKITKGYLTATGTVPTAAVSSLPSNPNFNKLITYFRSQNTKVVAGATTGSVAHGAHTLAVSWSVQNANSITNLFDSLTQLTVLLDSTDSGSGVCTINGQVITKTVGYTAPVSNGTLSVLFSNSTAETRVLKATNTLSLSNPSVDTITVS